MIKAVKRKISGIPIPKIPNAVEEIEVNERVDSFIESYRSYDIDFQIKQTSKTLASELLYLKFIQGIPIVGAISGFYDSKYMNQISKYANLKYQLRFLKNKL